MTSRAPRVSVVVVCWNAERSLAKCLRHLLAQEYSDYEVIVVDDGSTDDSLQVARRSLDSGTVAIVASTINRGCAHARNLGLRHADGDIVAFIDADGFAAPDWLANLVVPFERDPSIGAVASTVFFDSNPRVLNGAGGSVNRRGEGIDLNFGDAYEHATLREEVLYPMGCGMALRRSTAARVGEFDDRILNYYDDVDYGIRVWRAGYRVVLAPRAWIDHGFQQSFGNSLRKDLLCEQHRMRVVLKHAPLRSLAPWALREIRSITRAHSPAHELKLQAARWNARHVTSAALARMRLRGIESAPGRLYEQSWESRTVPWPCAPDPAAASHRVDMARAEVEASLLYGWFWTEQADGHSFRWAAQHAAVIVRLEEPARRLRVRYRLPAAATAGVVVSVLPASSLIPALVVELYPHGQEVNYPVDLAAGEYEVQFNAREPWRDPDPRKDSRLLGVGLSLVSFEAAPRRVAAGLDMAAGVEDQLLYGWYSSEHAGGRSFRWAGAKAAALVRLVEPSGQVELVYRLPPQPIGPVSVELCEVGQTEGAWSVDIPWEDGSWRRQTWPLSLPAADYEFRVTAGLGWSDPDVEHRGISLAVSSLSLSPAGNP
jgi:GT2 family glycosyltransferase